MSLAGARFDLQGADDGLPRVRRALANVFDGNGETAGQAERALRLPQGDVRFGGFVGARVAAAEQLGGTIVEVGAEGEAVASEFAGLVDFVQTLPQNRLLHLAVAVELKQTARLRPIVGERLQTQSPTLWRRRPAAAMQLRRVHADLVDLRQLVAYTSAGRSGRLASG